MDNLQNPLVTCVIPSYKRSDMINRAIDSVLAQTYQNIEILIVDDNEKGDQYSNRLKQVVESYGNPNVKLLTQPRHTNGAAARNYGIKHAQGEYIAFLDDDDEWLPTKIEKQIRYLQNNPEFDAVSTLTSTYLNGNLIYTQKQYDTDNLQFKVLLRKVGIATPTFLATKSSLVKIGAFDEKLMRHQDLQLFVAYLEDYRIGLVPEVLIKIHADSEINRPSVSKLIQIKKDYFKSIEKHLLKYTSSERRRIICNHNFEVAYIAFKKHKYATGLYFLLKSGVSIDAVRDVMERMKNRND